MSKITTLEGLHALYGEPVPASLAKVSDRLSPLYRQWIEASRFCILSTIGPDGTDGSPRGDDGPVVRIDDDRTLWMPDWQGNNRLDTLRNIVVDGRLSVLFLVPGSSTTVRVNGTAWLSDDPQMLQSFEQRGKNPKTVIVIEMSEVYSQCGKAIIRSGIWGRDDKNAVPTAGQIIAEMSRGEFGGDVSDEEYAQRAKPRMW